MSNVSLWVLYAAPLSTLIIAIAGCIGAFGSWITSKTGAKDAKDAKALAVQNKETLATVQKQFDGRLSELLQKAELAQRALGITEGQDKEREIQAGHLGLAGTAARKVVSDALEIAIEKLETEAEEARQLKAVAAALAEKKLVSEPDDKANG